MLQKHPERVIEKAVKGMLPRNNLAKHLLGHLKVYAGAEHPHEAQINASRKRLRGQQPAFATASSGTEK
jgi:ribosomal protein L13